MVSLVQTNMPSSQSSTLRRHGLAEDTKIARHHLCRQGVSLAYCKNERRPFTSANCIDTTRLQEREQGAAGRNVERRVDGIELVDSTDIFVCGESVAASDNHDLQQ